MANHKSASVIMVNNIDFFILDKYFAKTTRNLIKKLRGTTEKAEAEELYPQVVSMIDKLAKKNIVHKSKANNLKSKLAKHVSNL